MKNRRRIVSLLLATGMLLTAAPVPAYAAGNVPDSGITAGADGGEDAVKESEADSGSTLSTNTEAAVYTARSTTSTVDGYRYALLDANSVEITTYTGTGSSLTIPGSIAVPDGSGGTTEMAVTEIGDQAFYGCSSLTEVTIPAGVTSIGDSAFYGCSSLEKITIPESVTSIGGSAFSGCSSLTEVTIPAGVTSTGEYAFSGCSNLAKIVIQEGVTSIGVSTFSDCSSLTEVIIPESVTSIGRSAFSHCSSLTEVIIPESVTSIGDSTFQGCSNLTTVEISEGVKSIGEYAFSGCSLTSISIPKSVTSVGAGVFSGCSNLEVIQVEAGNTVYDSRNTCNAVIKTSSNTLIAGCKNTTIPASVTGIGDLAFSGCSSLTEITIPASVTGIGDLAFEGSSLTEITIPAGVTSIGMGVFAGCGNLAEIKVAEGNEEYDSRDTCNAVIKTSSNTLIAGCKNTTIPASVTSIGDVAFLLCNGLTEVTIPEGVENIGMQAFLGCRSLTEVTIPASVISIGVNAFKECSSGLVIYCPENSFAYMYAEEYNIPNGRCFYITATAGEGGSISPAGKVTVKENASQEFFFTPNDGYYLSEVKIDGTSVDAVTGSYTFGNVVSGHTIEAVFTEKAEQTITGTASYKKTVGDAAFALDAALSVGAGTLSYASSNDAVATVNTEGKVTIVGAGTATITVTAAETETYKEASFVVTITVVEPTTPTPTPGTTVTPTPTPGTTVTPTPGTTVTPTPGGTVTPTPGGTVTPAPGTTVTPTPGTTVTPAPGTTVTPTPGTTVTPTPGTTVAPTPDATVTPVPGIVEIPSSGEEIVDSSGEPVQAIVQKPGTTNQLELPGIAEGETVAWESTNTNSVEVDEDGNVTMKEPGMAEIIVTIGEGESARTETIVIVVEEEPEIVNDPSEAEEEVKLGPGSRDTAPVRTVTVGESLDINYYGVKNWRPGSYETAWAVADESVAAVDGSGNITALKPGRTTLRLSLKNKATGELLNVKPMEIIVPADTENKIRLGTSADCTFEELALALDERIDLNYYGVKNWKKEDYECTWISSEPTVVWVDKAGKLTPVSPGTATVTLVLVKKETGIPLCVVPVEVTVTE